MREGVKQLVFLSVILFVFVSPVKIFKSEYRQGDNTSGFESAMSESDGDSLLPELRDTFSPAGVTLHLILIQTHCHL